MKDKCERAHVVVLGGGFGGLTFCETFSHPKARVTIIDRKNHHLFQPLLYQVAMAGLSAPDIAQPIRSILARRPNLVVLLDEVREVNLAARRIVCDTNVLTYDYLVLALGSATYYFGHDEWARFAPGLKTLEDALLIRRNVLLAFEKAENERDPELQKSLMTLVIIGGGPTGVELAGACAELAHRVLRRDFDHIDPTHARIILMEAGPRILSTFPPDLSESGRKQLQKLGVEIHTGCAVKSIDKGSVVLASGETLRAGNIIWAAGVQAHPLAKTLGVELDRGGRLKVLPDLSVPGHPEVFAIGDMASLMEKGAAVPGVAPAAMQMARHVNGIIRSELDSESGRGPRPAFHYHDKGSLATIGRSAGVAVIGKLKLHGFIAWLSWLVIHLIFLIGFRNKVVALISWTYSYFTYKLGARIIIGGAESAPSSERR
jgi:NADH dehydrogenase